ncbi:MAG TPA: TolC family protein [Opitutaceae bacterium]|nr:TolC family protein [Opitutaceae bacterium]
MHPKSPKLGLFLIALAAPLSGADSASLTLEEALRSAEQINASVLIGREGVAQARAEAGQVRSNVLPNVALSAQQRRTSAVSVIGPAAIAGSPQDRFDANLTGNFDVLNPQELSALRAANKGVEVASFNSSASLQSALTDVAQTYFTHLRNLRRIQVLDANVDRARQLLDLASNQLKFGIATQIDVTRARSELAVAQQARLQQDTVVYQSDLQLKRLLNLDTGRTLQLADFPVRQVAPREFSATDEHDAFGQRADWLAAQKSLDQAKQDVRTAQFERLPALGLQGQYGYSSADLDDDGKKAGWFAGAVVSVPVFDGLRAGADRKLALSRQREQEFRLRDLGLQISGEVRLAVQDAASRFRQIDVAQTGLQLGEEELRLARTRFEQGVADNREVIEAQNTLALASDNFNEAIYQYNLSRVELARARGDVRGILTEKQE